MSKSILACCRYAALLAMIFGLPAATAEADVLVSTFYGYSENAFGLGSVERFNETSGQMTATGQIYDPALVATGVAQGPDGTIYVSNRNTGTIMHYTYGGAALGVFATLPEDVNPASPTGTGPAAPAALHFGPDGNLYVSDSGGSTIQRYNIATGQLMNNLVTGMASPGGFAFAANGDLYASDFGGGRVVKISGNLQNTTDVTPDAQGHSSYNYITANFNPQNGPVVPMQTPDGVLLAPNRKLLISDLFGNQVLTFDSQGHLINQATVPPPIPNPLPPGASSPSNNPGGLALDRNGNALLAVLGIDFNNSGTVLKYDTNGNYIATLSAGIPGASDLTLVSPQTTWTFTGGGNFGDSTNWDTQTVPNSIGASALFSSTINGGLYDVSVNNAYTVGSLLFTNTHGTTFGLVPDGIPGHGITLNNGGIGAAVNVTSDYHFIDAPLTLADSGGNTFYIAPNSTLIVGGKINESGGARSLNKAGAGALILTGANSYTGGTTVSNGLLILHAQTGAVIAAGTTVAVSNTASLELAGTVSALGSGTVNPVSVVNNSASPAGVSVSGTNQQAGGIDGTGTTVIEAGSDLTVGHVRQGAIVLDGTAASPAMLIIAPSSPPTIATASPIGELANSGAPLAGGSLGGAEFSSALNGIGNSAATDSSLPSSGSAVPEPSAVFLTLSAACGLFGYGVSLRRRERCKSAVV